ncbi:hypothetical protein PRIPAC_75412 [Pristionchus pacificus]|uniref:Uncharacterized protein n=1 Tax=Pristionchus pacificus TaxID=54126 RepID=A0A2A6C5P9_PRIPA|nr:hypothetical protein PRIPAC_75412 [Pristionchus pacificus]|eukprot:PDM73484.1 hypothetical protein PRIPAC_40840 [Pristionchus pacificus]
MLSLRKIIRISVMNSALFLLISVLALSAAQMTFSDGWEKRQPNRPYAHNYAHQKVARSGGHTFHEGDAKAEENQVGDEQRSAPMITEVSKCMEDYMAGVREMHAAMMELYTRFQTCENSLALQPGNHQKTSTARF